MNIKIIVPSYFCCHYICDARGREARPWGASQDRSATARGRVERFFSRKIFLTMRSSLGEARRGRNNFKNIINHKSVYIFKSWTGIKYKNCQFFYFFKNFISAFSSTTRVSFFPRSFISTPPAATLFSLITARYGIPIKSASANFSPALIPFLSS